MIRQALAALRPAPLLLAALVALAPLPFGGVLARDRAALAALAFLTLAVAVASRRDLAPLRARLPAAAIAAVGVLGLAQSVPWPAPLARLLSGNGARLWDEARGVLGDDAGWIPLSLAPEASRATGLHWLAVAAAFAAAALVGESRGWRRVVGLAVLAVGVLEVVYGADNWFRSATEIWGTTVPGDPGRLRGTYVNADHLAFLLAVPVTACHAWLWWALRRLSRRERLERTLLHLAVPALAFVVFFVGLAFTGSRSGLLAVAAAIVVQALALGVHYRRWQAALLGLAALGLGAAGLVLFGLQSGLGRWIETSAYEIGWGARARVYAASLELFGRFPLTGTGLGTFRDAFPLVAPADLGYSWHHAHSDVLELAVTAGLLGPVALAIGVVALARRLWTVVDRGRRSEERAWGLAGLGAVAAAFAHSCVDFGLTIPANAYLLAVVCGLAAGCRTLAAGEERPERRRTRRRGSASSPEAQPSPPSVDSDADSEPGAGRSATPPGVT